VAKRRDDSPGISLFPFLSILACTIGVLTLMIAAMTLSQVAVDQKDQNDEQAQKRLDKYRAAQERTRKATEEIQTLEARLDEATALAAELEKLRREFQARSEAAAKALAEAKTRRDQREILLAQAQELQKQAAARQAEQEKLQKEIESLKAELARRKDVQEGVVQVHPGGTGTDIQGCFIECAASHLVIHEGEPAVVKRDEMDKDARLVALLDRIARQPDRAVIFLVRSDAVYTYQLAARLARSHYARHGKLPIHREGKLDLSLFKKDKK